MISSGRLRTYVPSMNVSLHAAKEVRPGSGILTWSLADYATLQLHCLAPDSCTRTNWISHLTYGSSTYLLDVSLNPARAFSPMISTQDCVSSSQSIYCQQSFSFGPRYYQQMLLQTAYAASQLISAAVVVTGGAGKLTQRGGATMTGSSPRPVIALGALSRRRGLERVRVRSRWRLWESGRMPP